MPSSISFPALMSDTEKVKLTPEDQDFWDKAFIAFLCQKQDPAWAANLAHTALAYRARKFPK